MSVMLGVAPGRIYGASRLDGKNDAEWNAPENLDKGLDILVRLLRYRSTAEQVAAIDRVGKALGFSDVLKALARR